ncbi:TPA: hypothetical protein ACS72K_003883 [Providencia alcalifaciens]
MPQRMTNVQLIAFFGSRSFSACVWYDTSALSKSRRIYAKTRELIAGDRSQILCQQEIDKENAQ